MIADRRRRRPRSVAAASLAAVARTVTILAFVGGSGQAATHDHPWLGWIEALVGVDAPLSDDDASAVAFGEALEVTTAAAVGPGGTVTVGSTVRLRLDADGHLDRLRADRADLARLRSAHLELALRRSALDALGARCERAWRGWQAAVVAVAMHETTDGAAGERLTLLHAVLSAGAAAPADHETMTACRLAPWLGPLRPDPHAAETRIADVQERLAVRSADLWTAPAPAVAWVSVDAARSAPWPAGDSEPRVRLDLRAGIDIPFRLHGDGSLGVGVGASGTSLSLSWRWSPGDVTTEPPTGTAQLPAATEVERASAFDRAVAEARWLRFDAMHRWTVSCGAADAATVHACLRAPGNRGVLRDDLLQAVESELAAIRAELVVVDAAGTWLPLVFRARP